MIKTKLLLAMSIFAILISCRQEKLMFYPETLPANHTFSFNHNFKEYNIKVDEKTHISGVLFPADSSKGLIFYLHGNAGCIQSWGNAVDPYLLNNYDFFILDYRGYGKSQGRISGEKQLYNDIQIVYDSLKKEYDENKIIIEGYSIGTGPAAQLASVNKPKMLILQAPYYNLPDLVRKYVKILPSFLVKYKFRTDKYLTGMKCPIVIFHGSEDKIIYTGSSYKLQKLLKPTDKLIILEGQTHNGINQNEVFRKELKKILN